METAGVATGVVVGISATLPETFDSVSSTGYPSETYLPIVGLIDFDCGGTTWNVTESNPAAQNYPNKYPSTKNWAPFTGTVDRDDDNTGQAALITALSSCAEVAIEVIWPDGSEDYFTGRVSEFRQSGTNAQGVVQKSLNIVRTRDTVTVAA